MAHSRKGKNGTKNLKIAFFINVAFTNLKMVSSGKRLLKIVYCGEV